MSKENPKEKTAELIAEGDQLADEGKYDQAYEKYREANDLSPGTDGLFDKMLMAHEKSADTKEWDMSDFAEHLGIIMHKQEQENPSIRQVHARLSPEWKEVNTLILKVLDAEDEDLAGDAIEELVSKGEIATRALIEILRLMKTGSSEKTDE